MSPLNHLCTELLSNSGVLRPPWPWWRTHAPLYILWTQNAHGYALQPSMELSPASDCS